jgi:hypothetical protein
VFFRPPRFRSLRTVRMVWIPQYIGISTLTCSVFAEDKQKEREGEHEARFIIASSGRRSEDYLRS